MAITGVGLTGFQWAIELAETGINIQKFDVNYKPEFKTRIKNFLNQTIGFFAPSQLTRTVKFEGHVSSTGSLSGLMIVTWFTAITFANDVSTFLASATAASGGFYMEEMDEMQEPNDARRISGTAISDPLVT